MPYIYACNFVSPELPRIEPIEAPLPFASVIEFETWLRRTYIPRTLIQRIVDDPNLPYLIDVNKTECWGIFSPNGVCLKCCQVYPKTNLQDFPEFENFLQGKIFSHNHFSNSTLSCSEVLLWANLHMKEFRAVTENCTYLIRTKNQQWPEPNWLFDKINACPSINLNVVPNPPSELRHNCYQLLAEDGLFVYECIQIDHDL